MTLNYKKCGVMQLHGNKHRVSEPTDSMKLVDLFPKVDNYKYLGIELNQRLAPEFHVAKLEGKLKRYKKLVNINRFQGAPTNKIMFLWATFAESILSYGSFILAIPHMA